MFYQSVGIKKDAFRQSGNVFQKMNDLPIHVLQMIVNNAGHTLNIALVNRKFYQNIKVIKPMKLCALDVTEITINMLEWIYTVIGPKMFKLDLDYTKHERLIVFWHEHNHNKNRINMPLIAAKRGNWDQLEWCLQHGWPWDPRIERMLLVFPMDNRRHQLIEWCNSQGYRVKAFTRGKKIDNVTVKVVSIP